MSSPTPESEETRVTDAEVLWAATKAIHDVDCDQYPRCEENLTIGGRYGRYARAALEAAAALHPPREGADEAEKERDEALDYAARVNKQRLDAETTIKRLTRALQRIDRWDYRGQTAEQIAREALGGSSWLLSEEAENG